MSDTNFDLVSEIGSKYCKNGESAFRSSIDVSLPVTLTWSEMSAFVKVPASKNVKPQPNKPKIDNAKKSISRGENDNHGAVIIACEVDDFIILKDHFNEQSQRGSEGNPIDVVFEDKEDKSETNVDDGGQIQITSASQTVESDDNKQVCEVPEKIYDQQNQNENRPSKQKERLSEFVINIDMQPNEHKQNHSEEMGSEAADGEKHWEDQLFHQYRKTKSDILVAELQKQAYPSNNQKENTSFTCARENENANHPGESQTSVLKRNDIKEDHPNDTEDKISQADMHQSKYHQADLKGTKRNSLGQSQPSSQSIESKPSHSTESSRVTENQNGKCPLEGTDTDLCSGPCGQQSQEWDSTSTISARAVFPVLDYTTSARDWNGIGPNSAEPSHGHYLAISPISEPEASTRSESQLQHSTCTKDCLWQQTYFERRRRAMGVWKPILRGITGVVRPGELLAVIGASGSGKTTLLKALAYRPSKGCHVSGTVRVNGAPVKAEIQELSAYVQQQDIFVANLTVVETLIFRATLELVGSTLRRRRERVADILRDMLLKKCADKVVGCPEDTQTGISRGERKRLSIASEMISKPPLVFCDEPTTGMDVTMAERTVEALLSLAERQHTVVCTVHQPSSDVFARFDKVLVLTEGRLAFTGTSTAALNFFGRLGKLCPKQFNPADFFISTLAVRVGHENCTRLKAKRISQLFAASSNAEAIRGEIDGLASAHAKQEELTLLLRANVRLQSRKGLQCRANLWRFWVALTRQKVRFCLWVLTVLIQGLFIGITFFRLNHDKGGNPGYDQTNVLNVNGALFVICIFCCFFSCCSSINTVSSWIPIFLRDCETGLYRVDTFYVAISLAEILVHIVSPLVLITIDYWMIGLHHQVSSFFISVGIALLAANTSASFGHFLSTFTGDGSVAMTVAASVLLPLMILAGFIINDRSLASWLCWVRYVSWLRQSLELLVVNQWSQVTHIECPGTSNNGSQARCLFTNGSDVLDHLNFSAENNGLNYLLLVVLLVVFRAAAFLCLRARSCQN